MTTYTIPTGPAAPERLQALHQLALTLEWIAERWPEDDHRLALRLNEFHAELISHPRAVPKGEQPCR